MWHYWEMHFQSSKTEGGEGSQERGFFFTFFFTSSPSEKKNHAVHDEPHRAVRPHPLSYLAPLSIPFVVHALTTVCRLRRIKADDNSRHNVMGIARNVRSKEYPGGKMLLFEIEDETGTMAFVAWNDSHDIFQETIKQGRTIKISSVTAKTNSRYNRVEMKLYPDTRVEVCAPMSIDRKMSTIAEAKSQTTGPVSIKCIVSDLGDVEQSQKGNTIRKVIFVDASDQINGLFLGDEIVSSVKFGDGAVLHIEGNITASNFGGSSTLFVNSFSEIEDAELSKFWADSSERAPKRARIAESTLSSILEVKDAEVGAKGHFVAILRSCSAPLPMANDRVKRTLTVVDESMAACDVGFFSDKSLTIDVDVGSAIKFNGVVSSYNTRSLTTQAIEVVDDDGLVKFYSTIDTKSIKEISIDPRTLSNGTD